MSTFDPIETKETISKMKAEIARLEEELRNYRAHAPHRLPYAAEELAEKIYRGTLEEALVPGDYIDTELYTGEPIRIFCLGVGHDTMPNGGKADYSFGVMSVDSNVSMNEDEVNTTSWRDSKMRTVTIPRLMRLLPKGLTDRIVPVMKTTTSGDLSCKIITTEDLLFLFSEIEVYGRHELSFCGEGAQYELFKNAEYRSLLKNFPWLRSPYPRSRYNFCYALAAASAGVGRAHTPGGIAFGFCLSSKNQFAHGEQ